MKAPERLYLRKRNKLPLEVVRDVWYETDPQSPFGSVGYTRTDAFVEKAISYLNSKLYDWVQTTNPNQKSYANTIMKQDFINDFVNYIKGE